MRKKILSLLLAVTTAALTFNTQVAAAGANTARAGEMADAALEGMDECDYVKGEVIASFHALPSADLAKEGLYSANPFISIDNVSDFGEEEDGRHLFIAEISSKVYDTESLTRKLSLVSYVEGVQPNAYSVIESQAEDYQWYMSGSTGKVFTESPGIRLDEYKATDIETPVIAVIDTGIDYSNVDLIDKLWVNPYPDSLEGVYGYDTGDGDNNPMDGVGHGTHVAGVIAAADDGYGIKGVTDARIMSLKITQGSEKDDVNIVASSIIQALEYVYNAKELGVNIRVVNCSLGGGVDSGGAIASAINKLGKAGVLTVFAAGNDGTDVADSFSIQHAMPYCLNSPYVITVGSVSEDETVSGFSNYGADYVDVFAPGSNILSDYNDNLFLPQFMTDEERAAYSIYYNKFDNSADNIMVGGSDALYVASEIGVPSYYNTTATRLYDTGFCDSQESGSIRLDVTRSYYPNYNNSEVLGYSGSLFEEGGSVFIDVTQLDLDQNSEYYVSCLVGYDDAGTVDWETINMKSTPDATRFYNVGDRVYFRLIGLSMDYGSGTMYLDDIAVSKANIPQEAMSKMYLMSGTSMATPLASAAVALLSAKNPKEDALTLREYFLSNCVRRVKSVSQYCFSGGVVDMSGIAKIPQHIAVNRIKLNKKSLTVKFSKKKNVKLKATVKPVKATVKTVTWKSSNKKYATVDKNGKVKLKKAGIGHTVKITVKTTDGSGLKAVCKIKIVK
ncbi:MAG: S8 family serine peptidase [Lachnospiraceae bacterium]|nr:S8 family serine peptidase [Lachnospiraceae bacterium]